MKKIVIALFASIALVLGSGAFVGGASAAEYPGTVPTAPSAPPTVPAKPVTPGTAFKVIIKIGAGNAKISGKIKVTFNGKVYWFKLVNGKANIKLKIPKNSKAKSKAMKYEFKPYTGSVYKASKGKTRVKIKN